MISIKINNTIILIDIYKIDLRNWKRISKHIIEKYGFEFWFEQSYYVRHKDELKEKEA